MGLFSYLKRVIQKLYKVGNSRCSMESDSSDSSHWLTARCFTIILIVLLAAVVGIGYVLAQVTEYTLPEVMSVLSVLTSVALSAILAYLYLRMSKIQSDQRDISNQQSDLMRSQHELMRAEHTPVLSLGEISVVSASPNYAPNQHRRDSLGIELTDGEELINESLTIPLVNLGEGIATDLKIDMRVSSLQDGGKVDTEYVSIHRALVPNGSSKYGYISTNGRAIPLIGHRHNFLEPGRETFNAKMVFRMEFEDGDYANLPFSGIVKILQSKSVDRARVSIHLTYEDIVGNESSMRVVGYDFNVDNVSTLSDVIYSEEKVDPNVPIRGNEVEPS